MSEAEVAEFVHRLRTVFSDLEVSTCGVLALMSEI